MSTDPLKREETILNNNYNFTENLKKEYLKLHMVLN